MKSLLQFEKAAQRLVEGSFGRLFGGRLEPLEVATQIAQALEDSQEDGRVGANYLVRLQPDDLAAIQDEQPDLELLLAESVTRLAQQAGLQLTAPLHLRVIPDASLGRRRVLVEVDESADHDAASTQIFASERAEAGGPLAVLRAVDAFLIVQGRRHVALDRPVITIGRRADNDIVLELPTISRQHAQIRWRYGRFVIYDLGSRAGTLVNGQRVRESVLHPGDIITLSDVALIYGEGLEKREAAARQSHPDDHTHTMPLNYSDWLDGG